MYFLRGPFLGVFFSREAPEKRLYLCLCEDPSPGPAWMRKPKRKSTGQGWEGWGRAQPGSWDVPCRCARKIREKKELTPLDELCAGRDGGAILASSVSLGLSASEASRRLSRSTCKARSLEFKETLQCHCRHCRLRPSLDLLTLRRSGPTTSPYGSSLQMSVPRLGPRRTYS